jgi:hypothetical protein
LFLKKVPLPPGHNIAFAQARESQKWKDPRKSSLKKFSVDNPMAKVYTGSETLGTFAGTR